MTRLNETIRSVVSFVIPSPGLRPPSPKGRGAGGEGAGAEGRTHAKLIMSSCITGWVRSKNGWLRRRRKGVADHWLYLKQSTVWSLTIPTACMKA
jgi:hypothetical protein